jgi:hypothetical protein
MKCKKRGMNNKGAESKKTESAEGRMHKMEKAMHGKNTGKGYKGYGGSKGTK